MRERRTSTRAGRTLVAAAALTLTATACAGGHSGEQTIMPLARGGHVTTPATVAPTTTRPHDTGQPDSAQSATAPPAKAQPGSAPVSGPITTAGGRPARPEERREVDALLTDYDRALTALSAEPAAAGAVDNPLTEAWRTVVVPGSRLDMELRTRIATDMALNGRRYVPDSTGFSYRNRALGITVVDDGTVRWENCGYSPGVGVSLADGTVVDDARASTRGTARAHRGPDGRLVVDELVDEQKELLAEGVADPCEALAAAAGR